MNSLCAFVLGASLGKGLRLLHVALSAVRGNLGVMFVRRTSDTQRKGTLRRHMLRAPCRAAVPLRLVSVTTTPARPAHTTARAGPSPQAPRRSFVAAPASRLRLLRTPAPHHTTQVRAFATTSPMEARNKAAVEEFDKLVKDNKVMIFGRTSCPYGALVAHGHRRSHTPRYCVRAKKLFDGLKVPYKYIEVDTMDDGEYLHDVLIKKTSRRTCTSAHCAAVLTHSPSPQHLRKRHQYRRMRRYFTCAGLVTLTRASQTLSRFTVRASWSRCSSLRASTLLSDSVPVVLLHHGAYTAGARSAMPSGTGEAAALERGLQHNFVFVADLQIRDVLVWPQQTTAVQQALILDGYAPLEAHCIHDVGDEGALRQAYVHRLDA